MKKETELKELFNICVVRSKAVNITQDLLKTAELSLDESFNNLCLFFENKFLKSFSETSLVKSTDIVFKENDDDEVLPFWKKILEVFVFKKQKFQINEDFFKEDDKDIIYLQHLFDKIGIVLNFKKKAKIYCVIES